MTHSTAGTARTLTFAEFDAARPLLEAATRADGPAPLSDGLLDAAAAGSAVLMGVTAEQEAQDPASAPLVGVGVAALQGDRWAAEAVIDPAHRGRGLGRLLVTALDRAAREAGGRPWFWSHGDHPAAAHLAATASFSRSRELLQLTTEGVPDLPLPQVPAGTALRSVRPEDAQDWARVNNAAFSWHPEQGGQDPEDYRARLADPGFDLDSVVIAERTEDGRLLGFHETKMHASHPSGLRMGEVYVIGVDPEVHARGLGRALLLEGMHRLVSAGAQAIELYVESDNEKALPLYRATGFSRTVVHVSFEPAGDPHAA